MTFPQHCDFVLMAEASKNAAVGLSTNAQCRNVCTAFCVLPLELPHRRIYVFLFRTSTENVFFIASCYDGIILENKNRKKKMCGNPESTRSFTNLQSMYSPGTCFII